MTDNVELIGFDEIEEILKEIAPREANNLVRSFVHGLASEARKRIKRGIPRGKYSEGLLKQRIKSVRRKSPPGKPVSDVLFEGKEPFYWRFIEHGTADGRITARPFVTPVADEMRAELPDLARDIFMKKLEARLKRAAKSRGLK